MALKTLTTSEVRDLLGQETLGAARVQLHRWGVQAVGRTLNGEKTWPARQVRALAAARRGRGARTDLDNPKET